MIGSGTPFDDLFSALTARVGVIVSTEDLPSGHARVVMERSGAIGFERHPHGYQPGDDDVAIGRLVHPWTATIYAGSDAEVCAILARLVGCVDLLCGPRRYGWEIKPGKLEPLGGDGRAASWSCDVGLTLYTSVASLQYGSAAVSASTIDVLTPGGEGSEIAAQMALEEA